MEAQRDRCTRTSDVSNQYPAPILSRLARFHHRFVVATDREVEHRRIISIRKEMKTQTDFLENDS